MVLIFHSSTEGCCLIGGGGDSKGDHNGEECVVKISEPRAGDGCNLPGKAFTQHAQSLEFDTQPCIQQAWWPSLEP